jgi:hypothetical protein
VFVPLIENGVDRGAEDYPAVEFAKIGDGLISACGNVTAPVVIGKRGQAG